MQDLVPLLILLSLTGAILSFIFILPDSKRPKLNKFFRWVADVFNFRSLLIEQILKFMYIYATLFCILLGFFAFFEEPAAGLGLLIGGPIGCRLVFEAFMMFVILVKNTNEINKKMGFKSAEPERVTHAVPPVYAATPTYAPDTNPNPYQNPYQQ